VAEVHVGGHHRLGVADLLGDPAGLPVQGDRPVRVLVVEAGAEQVERAGLLGSGAGLPGNRDGLFAVSNGCSAFEGSSSDGGMTPAA
jgi:hypothetical protein